MSLLISPFGSGSLNIKNIWSYWIEHIMKKQKRLVLAGAALLRHTGETAASSQGFVVSQDDLMIIKKCFSDTNTDKIRVAGVTYCIKSRDAEHIVSFNGQTYIIVCKTNYMYIVGKCNSRKTSGKAAAWIKSTAEMIKAKKC